MWDLWKIIIYILALSIGMLLLIKGSDFFVDGAAKIATRFNIPELIIGLTIVAMGTSIPEAAVSISAAIKGNADITIGNIIGSNILNIFIILGISSVIAPLVVKNSTLRYEIPYMLGCTAILLVLGLDKIISLKDGILLWAVFIVYLIYLFFTAQNENKTESPKNKPQKLWILIASMLAGIISVIIGSKLSVYGASEIASLIGVSQRFIGLTIVALGTSLPELFTSVIAAKKGNADIAIGNIIGSNIFNILFIVGTTAFIKEVPFESKFIIDTIVALAAGIVLLICSFGKKKLNRVDGIIMLLCYGGYFVYLCVAQK